MSDISPLRLAAAAVAGIVAAILIAHLPSGVVLAPLILTLDCVALAVVGAVLLGKRRLGPGAALVWSLGFAFLIWLAWCAVTFLHVRGDHATGAMIDVARSRFALLVAVVVAAVPVGLALGFVEPQRTLGERRLNITRAICAGGFAGVFGGWAFGAWMERAGFFPLIATIVRSNSRDVGIALHFSIAIVLGMSFGLLFQREIRGLGSSLVWGAAYGMLWWFVGALTLLPILAGSPAEWSYRHAAALFGSLVGHIIYGLIVGLLYATVDGLWVWLFERSDPLQRAAEGSGHIALSSIARGGVASLVGGLLFSVVMFATGSLGRVAGLVGSTSTVVGFVVHLIIGAFIGATYGLLFHFESTDDASAIGWGATYGLMWWFLGPLTLFPILLGGTFAWTTTTADALLPSLVGHLIYGIALAITFRLLERRHLEHLFVDERLRRRWASRRRPSGTPAPAMWLFVIGMGIVLPIVLG